MAQQRSNGSGGSKRGGTSRKRTSGSTRAKSKASKGRTPTRGTAPSSPDLSKLHLLEASREAKEHEPSTQDAMGQDKRRAVIGHSYGPSTRSQVMVLGGVIAAFVVLIGGFKLLANHSDRTPKSNPDQAPWSKPSAPQTPAAPLE
jgi:hypothetical protein